MRDASVLLCDVFSRNTWFSRVRVRATEKMLGSRFMPGERRGLGVFSAMVAETSNYLLRDGQSPALVRRPLQNGVGQTGSEAGKYDSGWKSIARIWKRFTESSKRRNGKEGTDRGNFGEAVRLSEEQPGTRPQGSSRVVRGTVVPARAVAPLSPKCRRASISVRPGGGRAGPAGARALAHSGVGGRGWPSARPSLRGPGSPPPL